MDPVSETYKYYAFISYSRRNSEAVNYLHRQLEHFRIPRQLVKDSETHRDLRFLRPIFRDRRDLVNSVGNFTEDIRNALENSRYLIVLCSPEAAASPWVDKEVQYFLETHDNDYSAIVPVVLDGIPGSGEAEECLPPALRQRVITGRNLPNMKPESGESVKTGWENGVIQTLSYLLRVRREKIRAVVDAEKMRRLKIYVIIGAAAMMIFSGLLCWALYAQNQAEIASHELEIASHELEIAQTEIKATEERAKDLEDLVAESMKKADERSQVSQWIKGFMHRIFLETDGADLHDGDSESSVTQIILTTIHDEKLRLNELAWNEYVEIGSDFSLMLNRFGEYGEAIEIGENVHRLNKENRPGTIHVAGSAMNLSRIFFSAYKATGNEEYGRRALVFSQEALGLWMQLNADGRYDEKLFWCNLRIASIHLQRREFEAAFSHARSALDICGESDEDRALTQNLIGNIHDSKAEYEMALQCHEQAIGMLVGEDHPYLAYFKACIANSLICLGRFTDALEMANDALKLRKRISAHHPSVARSCNQISYIYQAMGDFNSALAFAEQALLCRKINFGERHWMVAEDHYSCGELFRQLGRLEDAKYHFEKALDIAEGALGESHETFQKYRSACIDIEQRIVAAGRSDGRQHESGQVENSGTPDGRSTIDAAQVEVPSQTPSQTPAQTPSQTTGSEAGTPAE